MVLGVTAAASLFAAGVQLALFDELARRVPPAYSPTFFAVEADVSHIGGLGAPLLGADLGAALGVPLALALASAVSLVGYGLLALDLRPTDPSSRLQEAT